MHKCWVENPDGRPTFSELSLTVDEIISCLDGYAQFDMVLTSTQDNDYAYACVVTKAPTSQCKNNAYDQAEIIVSENDAYGLKKKTISENTFCSTREDLTVAEHTAHGLGEGMSVLENVDVLLEEMPVTENSAYGLGEEMPVTENNAHGLRKENSACHGLGEEMAVTENNAYGLGEEMAVTENSAYGLREENSAYGSGEEMAATENSAYGLGEENSAYGLREGTVIKNGLKEKSDYGYQ